MSGNPVALFVYNRVDTTARVFARIAEARPPVLLVVADAPRRFSRRDAARCAAVRDLVTNPSWSCDVRLNVSPVHLGLGARFSSGLEWVFREVEEAIILEDDCLPDPTFFRYCGELLDHHRDHERVMMISGNNYQFGQRRGAASYYYSHTIGTYGWATWRRAFQGYDFEMRDWTVERQGSMLREVWPDPEARQYFQAILDEVAAGRSDSWDFQWAFTMWRRRGVQLAPNVNLVSYIGCLPDAVHTRDPTAPDCDVSSEAIGFPLVHPSREEVDRQADAYEFHRLYMRRDHEEAVARSIGGFPPE